MRNPIRVGAFAVASDWREYNDDELTSLGGYGRFAGWYIFMTTWTLKNFETAAACLWIICGVDIGCFPLVVANLVGGVAAVCSSIRCRSERKDDGSREQRLAMGEVTR